MRQMHVQMWRDNKLLMQLFEPEELEALVCGGTDLDFNALQRAAKYEDGFDEKSEVSLCCTRGACASPLTRLRLAISQRRSAALSSLCACFKALKACGRTGKAGLIQPEGRRGISAHTVGTALQVIGWFWEVVHGFTEAQKKRLLMFVTGSDRVPIKGLASLQPPFVISRNGPASDRLPTAHTCFNHLLLPAYKASPPFQASCPPYSHVVLLSTKVPALLSSRHLSLATFSPFCVAPVAAHNCLHKSQSAAQQELAACADGNRHP